MCWCSLRKPARFMVRRCCCVKRRHYKPHNDGMRMYVDEISVARLRIFQYNQGKVYRRMKRWKNSCGVGLWQRWLYACCFWSRRRAPLTREDDGLHLLLNFLFNQYSFFIIDTLQVWRMCWSVRLTLMLLPHVRAPGKYRKIPIYSCRCFGCYRVIFCL